MSMVSMISMEWTDDLDVLCGYLSLVDGINGAALLGTDGLPIGRGADSQEDFDKGAPWILQSQLDAEEFAQNHDLEIPDEYHSFTSSRFWLCRRIGSSYLVVHGTRGSLELFHGRIDRCAQMILQALKQRRLAE
ncbi:MAG: hypothetical protein RL318_2957 [Fibrobacterota bacterium]|jgi:hypothetical protein